MRKRFFLLTVFLILLAVFIWQGNKEKYHNQNTNDEITTAKIVLQEHEDDARNIIIPDFIVPCIFIFTAYIYSHVEHMEFKIGVVDRKPKYRKQLPRGNLV